MAISNIFAMMQMQQVDVQRSQFLGTVGGGAAGFGGPIDTFSGNLGGMNLGGGFPGLGGGLNPMMFAGGGFGLPFGGGFGGGFNPMMMMNPMMMLMFMLMSIMQQGQQGHRPGFPGQQGGPFAAAGVGPNGPWAFAGAGNGDVKFGQGNPDKWYFGHGNHKVTKTDYGHIDEGGNTKIVYDEKSKTGYVYTKAVAHAEAWQLSEVRSNWEGKSASPIMLDMDGNGRPDVKNGEWKPHAEKGDQGAHKINFDLNGDGKKELTEWTGGKDGLLLKLSDEQKAAYDKNGRLEVSGKELYGDEGGKYADGYEKMRKLSDANNDGKLGGDELKNHYVWQDANRDGIVDKGEMTAAQKAGITEINATHGGDYQSSFKVNGQERKTWDWWPTTWN
ncbi:MAG: hypothetical protein FJX76_15855 [Armatimonadetes bacterium]|nr:hypothetical protein [Armatimonadota bacterium]